MKARGTWPGRGPEIVLTFDDPAAVRAELSRTSAVTDSGCIEWTGAVDSRGYARMRVVIEGRRVKVLAHRAAYTAWRGQIPVGLTLDHTCANKSCINPDHLEPVTQGENVRRGPSIVAIHAAKTHCIRGHELSGDNLKIGARGRICRECQRMHRAARGADVRRAVALSGLSHREYLAKYGDGRTTALRIIAASATRVG